MIDLTLFDKVKVDKMDKSDDQECIKYKYDGKHSKLESKDCDETRNVGCYAFCGEQEVESQKCVASIPSTVFQMTLTAVHPQPSSLMTVAMVAVRQTVVGLLAAQGHLHSVRTVLAQWEQIVLMQVLIGSDLCTVHTYYIDQIV